MKNIAVVGAGIAGLTLGRLLADQAKVVVFEKSRSVGGRMATRRNGEFSFDHGAQFFTARSRLFRRFLQDYRVRGVIQEWQPRVLTLVAEGKPWKRDWFEPHYVAVPGMTALCKAMAEGLELRLGSTVAGLKQLGHGRWAVQTQESTCADEFDWVLFTTPPPQASSLLPADFVHHAVLEAIGMEPCIALLLGLEGKPPWRFDAARIRHPLLDWITCESSRPGRSQAFGLTLHSSAQWAAQHFEATDEELAKQMLAAFQSVLAAPLPSLVLQELKRWRYAKAPACGEPLLLLDAELQLAACGDWCRDGRVEGAFLAAHELAGALRHWL